MDGLKSETPLPFLRLAVLGSDPGVLLGWLITMPDVSVLGSRLPRLLQRTNYTGIEM